MKITELRGKLHGYQRFIVVFVAFLGVINTYIMRNTLGLTMTKLNPKKKRLSMDFTEEFQWSSRLESLVHASFYFGYVIGHVPGSYLAERYGGKIVLNVGLFSTAVFTIVTPMVIEKFGAYGLIVMRMLMGLGEAPAFPVLGNLLSAWIPPSERGVLSAFVLGGVQVGSLLSSLISGEILEDTEGWGHFTTWDKPEMCGNGLEL